MCGICGFIDYKNFSDISILNKMVTSLHHRGPNDKGSIIYSLGQTNIGLGHTRLSILDLSMAGHQPMIFNHLTIVFNGEIYNFKEIKIELIKKGHKFISETDTEVILHSYLEWGNLCASKFIGMFVFVIYDRNTNKISLFRDRAGVKPLFYYWKDDLFMFASELKVLHEHPNFQKKINEKAVFQYMDFGYIPSPNCIFENCRKLEPGHIFIFDISNKSFKIEKYWDVDDYYRLPKLDISYIDAKYELEKLLTSAFEYRMVSDVPVGVFLSGGYDSTAVTALLQCHKTEKLKTFTIGFEEGNNEAPYAKNIAKHLGTDHTEFYCTTNDAQQIIPSLPYYFDEPFADSSAIPTILVSKLAKEKVTVALSADAGDEIFAGYSTYKSFLNDLSRINIIPNNFKNEFLFLINQFKKIIPKQNHLNYKLDVLSKILEVDNKYLPQTLLKNYPFVKLSSQIQNLLFINKPIYSTTSYDKDFDGFNDKLSIALAVDYTMYLQNDILTKVDRATMSVSLEGREPYLDHRIIEYVAQLPNEYKYGFTQKMILKDIVHKYVPQELLDRPKAGFSLPINNWLKDDLFFLINDNLNKTVLKETGFFDQDFVSILVNKFLNNKLYNVDIIWKLIQFQIWYKKWM